MLLLFRCCNRREREIERASNSNRTLQPKLTAVQFHQAARNCQPEARSLCRFFGFLDPMKGFEDPLLLLWRDAGARIANFNADKFAEWTRGQFNRPALGG